ncbi:site-specific integrase [Actinospica robiniae]|uniref:site-specific integrase n=1 Tax=Actinospica robiniae TaxID=304901 RepID=UPI000410F17B|nr:site-specific integrase [Actinospica robiniae]
MVADRSPHRPRQLSIADVRRFVTRLQTTCQCCAQSKERRRKQSQCCAIGTCFGQYLAPTTVHRIYQVLVAALNHAVREECLHRNVAALVKVPTGHDGHTDPEHSASTKPMPSWMPPAITASTPLSTSLPPGMRRCELLSLRWQDIDLDAGTLTIHQTLQRLVGAGNIFTPPRTPPRSAPSP